MAQEPGQGENQPNQPDQKRITIDEATRRLEDAAEKVRQGVKVVAPGGSGGGNGKPPAPPIREGPEEDQGGNSNPDQSSEKKSSKSGQENVNPSQESQMSREEFVQQATQYLNTLKTSEFKPIFAKAISTVSPKQIALIHSDLRKSYDSLQSNLQIQKSDLVNLQPNPNIPPSPEVAAKIEAIDLALSGLKGEYNEITNLLVSQIPRQPERESDRAQGARLEDEISELEEQLELADKARKKEIKEAIRERMETYLTIVSPESNPISDNMLRVIGQDEVLTEEFMGRLLAAYQEEDQFQIRGLYGGVNLDVFLKVNQDIPIERMSRLQNLIEASKAFHNMNFIIKRSFDSFVEQSKVLLPKHFEVIGQIPGVGQVFRTYERLMKEELGEKTMITEPALEEIEATIKKVFKERNEADRLGVIGLKGGQLEDWEIDRALVYGRNLHKVSVRAAELIAQSELPADQEKYVSPPQKELTQIMHTLKYVVFRFAPNESQGGPELIESVLEERREKRKDKGKVRIKTLEGTDVDMRELQQIVSARGIFATWRLANALLAEVKIREGGKVIDIRQFFRNHAEEIQRIKDLGEDKGWEREYKNSGEKAKKLKDWKKDKVKDLFEPLLRDNSVALGVLVSGNGLNVPTELKEILWERIAEMNPLVMASLLTRLQVDKDDEGKPLHKGDNGESFSVESLEDILLKEWGTNEQKDPKTGLGEGRIGSLRAEIAKLKKDLSILKGKESKQKGRINNTDAEKIKSKSKEMDEKRSEYLEVDEQIKRLFKNENWIQFKDKLNIANELRMKDELERIEAMKEGGNVGRPKELREYLGIGPLSPGEENVLEAIKKNGQKIARDLANIKQVTAWFLNDTPVEIMKWSNLGQNYDRQTNDLANFHKSAGAILKAMGAPFASPPHEIIKTIREAMGAAGDVLGLEVAQENMEPILTQYLSMIYENPKDRQVIISAFRHGRKEPTSRAQEITGSVDSPSVNEETMYQLSEEALHMGAYRKDVIDPKTGKVKHKSTIEHAEKKFGLQWYKRFIWANLRDYGPFFLAAFFIKFFKDIFKESFSGK